MMLPTTAAPTTRLQAAVLRVLLHLGCDWLLWGVALLAGLMVLLVLDRLRHLAWSHGNVDRLRRRLGEMLRRHQIDRAQQLVRSGRSPAARIAAAALLRLEHGPAVVEDVLVGARLAERLRLERGIASLLGLAWITAALGLVGLALGLVRASAAGAPPGAASAGLAVLAVALAAALPGLVVGHTLRAVVRRRLLRADMLGRTLLAYARRR